MASTATLAVAVANLTILSYLITLTSSQPIQLLEKTLEEHFIDCFKQFAQPMHTSELVYTPGTPSYDTYYSATIKNLRYLNTTGKKPSIIIKPLIEFHVQRSVACARNASLDIRVRSGGHDYEGLSYVSTSPETNPYVLIDLAYLSDNRYFQIDLASHHAWVSAGATTGQLYYQLALASTTVAFPAGICPTIGIGGHFGGGGIGALMRKYGVSADNIEDVLMVSPDGLLLQRSNMSEDHFWAIRGGGSGFGIILRYKIKLVDVPPTVTIFAIDRTLEHGAAQLVEQWQHVAPKLDEGVFIRILAKAVDDEEARGNRTIKATFQCLFLGEANELVPLMKEKFPELGVRAEDCEEMQWIESALNFSGYGRNESWSILSSTKPQFDGSFKAKSDFVKEPIPEEGWEKIWKFIMEGKDEPATMIMDPWGGKLDEIDDGEIAFPHRKGNLYNIQYYMWWPQNDEKVAEGHLDWMREFYNLMTPYVSSNPRAAYINYKDLDLGWNKGGRANYSEASVWGEKYFLNNFEKLAYVKGEVDPDYKFWNELSIPPLFKN